MQNKKKSLWVALGLVVVLGTAAHAATYVGHATATVSYMDGALSPFAGVNFGDTITLDYTFDSSTPNASADATRAIYAGALTNITLSAGSFSVSYVPADQNFINVSDNRAPSPGQYQDSYELQANSASNAGLQSVTFLRLADPLRATPAGGALSSTVLPLAGFDPALFGGQKTLEFDRLLSTGGPTLQGRFGGVVDSWTITPVPLPAALWLLVSGVGAVGVLGRRAKAA